uniref:Uncharacterized protein n=1 Tax=Aegilops tauschii subsp. strangulata TaxID=200361 RepID=A0A453AQT2_AEGTS
MCHCGAERCVPSMVAITDHLCLQSVCSSSAILYSAVFIQGKDKRISDRCGVVLMAINFVTL